MSVWIIGGVVAVMMGAVAAVWLVRRRNHRQLVSIVLLRRSQRGLTEAEVRAAARRAIRPDVEVVAAPSPDPGVTGAFIVMLDGSPGFFIVDAARSYGEDTEAEAARFEDPRAREAYAAHRAWVSVDLVGGMPPENVRAMVLSLMARLAAELYDEECTLLYAPAMERVALPGPGVEERLRGADPMGVFGDDEVNTPIFHVGQGDAAIERAMEEARRQWPRFVEVWKQRGAACQPIVKGRFTADGGNEYMWIEVKEVHDGHVSGVLANKPARVPGAAKGQTVTIPVDDVADWACLDGDRPLGMFVERLLTRR